MYFLLCDQKKRKKSYHQYFESDKLNTGLDFHTIFGPDILWKLSDVEGGVNAIF